MDAEELHAAAEPGPVGAAVPAGGPEPEGEETGAVHYWFPVQVEVLQAAPVDHDDLVDRTLRRLAEGVEGASAWP